MTRKQTCHFRKNGKRPVTLLAVTYEGILQVTDPEAFPGDAVSGHWPAAKPTALADDHPARRKQPWMMCRAFRCCCSAPAPV